MIAQGSTFPACILIIKLVTIILLIVSASLATRSDEDDRIEIADPNDPTKMIRVEEKYPGESQWCVCQRLVLFSLLMNRMSQIAATEEQMRAEGKIDKEGHLVNVKNGKKLKESAEKS